MYDFHHNFIKKILTLTYCLLIETVSHMKSSQKMFMKIFLKINTYLILVNNNQNVLIQVRKKLLEK